ncbi:MAG: hypothetical protein Q7J07_03755, partial [Pelolinea sp.]|nr:hypothetical protein [Pelolinea sp.]
MVASSTSATGAAAGAQAMKNTAPKTITLITTNDLLNILLFSPVMNPKNWTQKWGFLFNLSKHILPIPIVLKFDRG